MKEEILQMRSRLDQTVTELLKKQQRFVGQDRTTGGPGAGGSTITAEKRKEGERSSSSAFDHAGALLERRLKQTEGTVGTHELLLGRKLQDLTAEVAAIYEELKRAAEIPAAPASPVVAVAAAAAAATAADADLSARAAVARCVVWISGVRDAKTLMGPDPNLVF